MRLPILLTATAAIFIAVPATAQTRPTTGPFPLNSVTDREHDGPQGEQLRASVKALQTTLTELQQLQLQLKQAHWNVSGILFFQLHGMLQEHYEGTAKYADEIAERLQSIGVSSDGRATTIVRTSAVPEYPGGFSDDAQVLTWFTHNYKVVSDEIGQGIQATEKSDPSTSNLLQEVQNIIDKYQWQMRAHLQSTPTDPNSGAAINNGQPALPPGTPTQPIGY